MVVSHESCQPVGYRNLDAAYGEIAKNDPEAESNGSLVLRP